MSACILDLFRRKALEPKKKTATEWASPCPNCGGTDRCSIWPDDQEGRGYYWCRRCEVQGDGIQFLRDFCDLTYTEACKEIGVSINPNYAPPRRAPGPNRRDVLEPKAPAEAPKGTPSPEGRELWKTKATAFASWAHARLMERPADLTWLERRGLPIAAVKRYGLGWNEGERGKAFLIRSRESWGLTPETKKDGKPLRLWIPGGLVIPHLGKTEEGASFVRRLRIRRTDEERARFNPEQKYYVIPGSEMDMLYLPCEGQGGPGIIVVVESELDALLLHHLARDFVGVVAAMTSTVKRIPADIFTKLQAASCILVALDFDQPDAEGTRAGTEGWPRWNETFARAKRWPVPDGKDPGEAYERGENLRLWLQSGIPAGLRLTMSPGQTPVGLSRERVAPEPVKEQPETYSVEYPASGRGGPGPGVNGMRPADWLTHPIGPMDSLRVLARAGLTAVPSGDDFTISGHEKWSVRDTTILLGWLRRHGEWVWRALYPQSAEARVSPQRCYSTGRPDEATSDQDHSPPSCCVTAIEA